MGSQPKTERISKSKTGTYVFLDSGNELAFVSEQLAEKSELKQQIEVVLNMCIFATKKTFEESNLHICYKGMARKVWSKRMW